MRYLKFAIALVSLLTPGILSAQEYLPYEQEIEIKTSDKYYWGEGINADDSTALKSAMVDLTESIVSDILRSTVVNHEALTGDIYEYANMARLENMGDVIILAWIDKESLFFNIDSETKESAAVVSSAVTMTELPAELLACGTLEEFRRYLLRSNFVVGQIGSCAEFTHPERCYVAVFRNNQAKNTAALLSPGDESRTDLLTGVTFDNIEEFLDTSRYILWYFQ